MTILFICSIQSPQCAHDKNSKKTSIAPDFSSPCFDVAKTWNLTPGGVQNRETKTTDRRLGVTVTSFQELNFLWKQISPTFSYFLINNEFLYHFLANLLAHNKKMTEKSVFREAWMTSQSFPVSCFWSRGCTLPEVKFHFLHPLLHKSLTRKQDISREQHSKQANIRQEKLWKVIKN